MHVVIDRRFCGPPDAGHGGYTGGLLAERLGAPCVAVSFRAPAPLERELAVATTDEGAVELRDGDQLVARAQPADLHLEPPPAPAAEAARAAAARNPWIERHPFPRCFGCGPERTQDEAVAIVTGPLGGGGAFAGAWTPLAEFAAGGDAVTAPFVWAALDCATAAPVVPADRTSVLARLTARLVAPVRPGAGHTVVAWKLGHDGRKHLGAAAIHGPAGELCAYSEGLWIELRDPAAMGASS